MSSNLIPAALVTGLNSNLPGQVIGQVTEKVYDTVRLTIAKARSLNKPGRHSDGSGLYLRVRKSGSKSWIFQHGKNGKYREIGLGSFDMVSLAEAKMKAKALSERLYKGLPLVEVVEHSETTPTFIQCVDTFLAAKEAGWKNDKHCAQWHMTLKKYAKPLHNMEVTEIKTAHVLKILGSGPINLWIPKRADL